MLISCLGALIGAAAAQGTIHINPKISWGTWEGWGVSLCWWANVLGSDDSLADVIFTNGIANYTTGEGNSIQVPSLSFNIARYNVGGSNNVTVNGSSIVLSPNFPWWKQIAGFWVDGASTDPTSPSWDWTIDSNQRAMVTKAVARGANSIEFFSNSPMWWSLVNHNPSGSDNGSSDNLRPEFWRSHAQYMSIVARKAITDWGIPVSSVEPLNEPIATWWKASGTQEGCHFDATTQAQVIEMLREELDNVGLSTVLVSASDESLTDMGLATWQSFNATTRAAISQVNVHGYEGTDGNRSGLYEAAVVAGGKSLRLSEHGEGDGSGATLAQTILLDFHSLHMTSWVYWQVFDSSSGWALIPAPGLGSENPSIQTPTPKYYTLAQYSRHVKPGMTIMDTGDAYSVAAFSASANNLVVVATNLGTKPADWTFVLTQFSTVAGPVTRWATLMADDGDKYAVYHDVVLAGKTFSSTIPANTVVTFEVEGVHL